MNIRINGLDELRKKLGDLKVLDVLESPMQDAVIRLEGRMKKYPPQRPTTYRRTGTLGRRWVSKVTRTGDNVVGTIGNNTVYGPFVQSKMFQARVHKRHWQTDQSVLDDERDNIIRDFERAVAGAL